MNEAYYVLEVVLKSESPFKAEIYLKNISNISNFKIDFLKRPNGKVFMTYHL